MNLTLSNATEILDADAKLLRFMRSEHELYDAVPVPQDSTLSLFDILLSITVNSRLDTATKVQSVWRNNGPVEEALAGIPAQIALEEENVPWNRLQVLFDRFCGIKFVGPAVSTKILHKKRPKLIPIFDNVISVYIRGCNEDPLPARASEGAKMVHGIKCFRKLLVGCLDQIQKLLVMPGMRRYPVSPVRALEVLLWIENEPSGYYRNAQDRRG